MTEDKSRGSGFFSVIENKKGGIDMDKALERELIQKGRDFLKSRDRRSWRNRAGRTTRPTRS